MVSVVTVFLACLIMGLVIVLAILKWYKKPAKAPVKISPSFYVNESLLKDNSLQTSSLIDASIQYAELTGHLHNIHRKIDLIHERLDGIEAAIFASDFSKVKSFPENTLLAKSETNAPKMDSW